MYVCIRARTQFSGHFSVIAVRVHGDGTGIVIVVLVDIWWITGEYCFSLRLDELVTILEHHTIQS